MKPEERREKQISDAIISELKKISSSLESILDKQQRSVSDTDVSHRKDPVVQLTSGLADVADSVNALHSQQKTDNQEANAFQKKSLWVQLLLFLVTAGALAAAAYYAHIARLQKDAMNETLIEVRKQAKSAEDAVTKAQAAIDVTRENFVQEQRPYVWLTDDVGPFTRMADNQATMPGRLAFNFHFTNYGKSPAIRTQVRAHIVFSKSAVDHIQWDDFTLTSGSVVPPGKIDFNTAWSDSRVEPELLNRIQTKDRIEYVFVVGRIGYIDLVGKSYMSEFCFERSPALSLLPTAPGTTKYSKQEKTLTLRIGEVGYWPQLW